MARATHVRKGDLVVVISGAYKGKRGKILRLVGDRVVVEKVAMIKRHQKPTQKSPQGGILQREGTIHVSNVMLICPSCGEATRVGRKREDGIRIRVCKKCGKAVEK